MGWKMEYSLVYLGPPPFLVRLFFAVSSFPSLGPISPFLAFMQTKEEALFPFSSASLFLLLPLKIHLRSHFKKRRPPSFSPSGPRLETRLFPHLLACHQPRKEGEGGCCGRGRGGVAFPSVMPCKHGSGLAFASGGEGRMGKFRGRDARARLLHHHTYDDVPKVASSTALSSPFYVMHPVRPPH